MSSLRFPAISTLRRRAVLTACIGAAVLLSACGTGGGGWHHTDVSGNTPDLAFRLTRASDGRTVTERDYRGKVVLVYFGYTYCPDVCPLTLSNLAQALNRIDGAEDRVRVLFITVDPERDTRETLRQYTANFGPEFAGLRGSDNALARVAKRYRVAYSADPAPNPADYVVTHSSAVYAFDEKGEARLLLTGLSDGDADIDPVVADLKKLMAGQD
ncbi:SCO family protein [Stakelama saccharophila]|uniref:SCO family protein n=1 Tax=Stakelama saccharophila TaxID=3075605 RepID=A0ABZ0B7F3_9SPHN|nr:SCO family protein [Stakelama sp. W311]WNO53157.1 SCO family protein [Stakelama sp. W311]